MPQATCQGRGHWVDGPPVSCRLTVDSTAAALQPLTLPAASLTDQTLAAIRQATRSGALQPEQLYSAYQIAAMPGVSQSPVREALMRLVKADMIKLERNHGFPGHDPRACQRRGCLPVAAAAGSPGVPPGSADSSEGVPEQTCRSAHKSACCTKGSSTDSTPICMVPGPQQLYIFGCQSVDLGLCDRLKHTAGRLPDRPWSGSPTLRRLLITAHGAAVRRCDQRGVV